MSELRRSPQCVAENHEHCLWYEFDGTPGYVNFTGAWVPARVRRVYWCECECHGSTDVVTPTIDIDLTGAELDLPSEEREAEREPANA